MEHVDHIELGTKDNLIFVKFFVKGRLQDIRYMTRKVSEDFHAEFTRLLFGEAAAKALKE